MKYVTKEKLKRKFRNFTDYSVLGGAIGLALGSGIVKGVCAEKGIDLPAVVDPLLSYGVTAFNTLGLIGYIIYDSSFRGRPSHTSDIVGVPLGIGLTAIVSGIGTPILQGVGYGIGYVGSKFS